MGWKGCSGREGSEYSGRGWEERGWRGTGQGGKEGKGRKRGRGGPSLRAQWSPQAPGEALYWSGWLQLAPKGFKV